MVGFELDKQALSSYNYSLGHHFQQSLQRLTADKTFSRILRIIAISAVTIAIAVIILKRAFTQHAAKGWLLLIPVLAVLPMFILGIDFYRWLAAMQLNFFVVAAYYLWSEDIKLDLAWPLLAAWYVLAIYSGPFGVSVAMPDRMYLIDSLLGMF